MAPARFAYPTPMVIVESVTPGPPSGVGRQPPDAPVAPGAPAAPVPPAPGEPVAFAAVAASVGPPWVAAALAAPPAGVLPAARTPEVVASVPVGISTHPTRATNASSATDDVALLAIGARR